MHAQKVHANKSLLRRCERRQNKDGRKVGRKKPSEGGMISTALSEFCQALIKLARKAGGEAESGDAFLSERSRLCKKYKIHKFCKRAVFPANIFFF
jgi:hypothetical protein